MPFEQKPNTGALFKNDDKKTDKHPNARGSALIDGVEYWVAAWTNDGKEGKYQSLKFSRKDENKTPRSEYGGKSARQSYEPPPDDFDDSLPF